MTVYGQAGGSTHTDKHNGWGILCVCVQKRNQSPKNIIIDTLKSEWNRERLQFSSTHGPVFVYSLVNNIISLPLKWSVSKISG